MHPASLPRAARAASGFIACLVLAGCFGKGEGPEVIPGTPAPPPPPSLCDPATAEADGTPFPIYFENLASGYDFGMDAGFGGGATVVVDNPVCSAENPTPQVARAQKFAAEPFGGSTLQLNAAVDFSEGTAFTMKVWSQRPVPVTFKFENSATGQPADGIEQVEDHSGSGEWETLCFDFSATPDGIPTNSITFIFDNGVVGDADQDPDNWTFYMDAIEQSDVCPGAPTTTLPVDFEDDPASYQFNDFAGGVADVITNPDQSGVNTTAQTARMQKFAGEIFGGSTLALAGNVDFTQGTAFNMAVWSPRAVPVLFKFEDAITGDPNNGIEVSENHPGGSEWQTLCFDFGASANGFSSNAITFIFDGAAVGDADNDPDNWTFYFDEIEQVASCGGPPPPPAAFETITFDDSGVTYALRGFGGAEDSTIQPDPEDASNNVVQVNRSDSAETFAGTVVSTGANESVPVIPLDAANTELTMRVRSPAVGIPVRLKIENADDAAISVETEVTTTVADAWETLTFDFTNEVSGTAAFDPGATYNKVAVFFNFGTDGATAGAQTFYFDDIGLPAPPPPPPQGSFETITFDDSGVTYALRGFGGAEDSTIQPDPEDASNNVVQVNRSDSAETFAGTVVSTGANESVPDIPLDAMNTVMSVRVYAPAAGIPVRLKIENADDAAISVETEATTTAANAWETLSFDFANEASGTAAFDPTATYNKIAIFFNFGTEGATAGAQTFFFDDIAVGGGGGGGGGTSAPTSVDFESGSVNTTDFGGGASMLGTNPDTGGINPSTNVLQLQKFPGETFGGSTVELPGPVDFANGEAYQIKVYSTRAVDVLFKLDGLNQERTLTHGGTGWESLCFDFTGTTTGDPAVSWTFIFDNGTQGAADTDPGNWTFYVDDIEQVASCGGGGGGTGVLPVDFEASATSYTFNDFDGGVGDVVANPEVGTDNPSAQVARMQKFAGAVFGGTTLDLGGTFDLPAGSAFTMKVRATRAVPVLFKLEGGPVGEVEVNHGGTGWEELCFDFDGVAAGNGTSGITFIFDNGTAGAAATDPDNWTFYFDDIELVSDCPAPPQSGGLPTIDFESGGAGAGFTWSVFENADNPPLQIITNPDQSGVNTSATVAEFTARVGGQPFAGTITNDLPTFTLDASNAIVKIKVWKTVISDVGIKFENATGGSTGEIKVANTVTNQWEELTFDFTGVIGNSNNTDITGLVVFPDFDARTQDNVIYFDDITFGDGS